MKIFLRILLILLAALVVVGATVALTQLEAVQAAIASERHGPPAGFEAGQMPDFGSDAGEALTDGDDFFAAATEDSAAFPGEVERHGGREEGGGNLAGVGEIVKNLVIVVVITLAVAIPSALAQRLRRQRRTAVAAGRVAPL